MAHSHPHAAVLPTAAHSLSLTPSAGRKTRKQATGPCCAAFVSAIYMPHIRLRKRSLQVY